MPAALTPDTEVIPSKALASASTEKQSGPSKTCITRQKKFIPRRSGGNYCASCTHVYYANLDTSDTGSVGSRGSAHLVYSRAASRSSSDEDFGDYFDGSVSRAL
jgi:hypothetical protein